MAFTFRSLFSWILASFYRYLAASSFRSLSSISFLIVSSLLRFIFSDINLIIFSLRNLSSWAFYLSFSMRASIDLVSDNKASFALCFWRSCMVATSAIFLNVSSRSKAACFSLSLFYLICFCLSFSLRTLRISPSCCYSFAITFFCWVATREAFSSIYSFWLVICFWTLSNNFFCSISS